MNKEPTAIISAIGALISSLIKAAVLLNLLVLDAQQLAGLMLVVDNALVLLGVIFIRTQVTPTAAPKLDVGTEVNHGDAVVVAK